MNRNDKNERICVRREQLRRIRNMVDFKRLFHRLGWPWKQGESQMVFVCPLCMESKTSVNTKTNLARCFRCEQNWNPIDFTMEVGRMEFLEAVGYLEEMFPSERDGPDPTDASDSPF